MVRISVAADERTGVAIRAGESTYTELGVDAGIAGVAAFVLWSLALLVGLWRREAWLAAAFAAVLLLGLQTDVIGVHWIAFTVWAAAGLALADAGVDSETTLEEVLPGPEVRDPVNQVIASEELDSLVSCLTSVLSELESHVLSLYLDGHSYEVIGEQLECDTKTVDNALQRVKRKVGIHLASRAVMV